MPAYLASPPRSWIEASEVIRAVRHFLFIMQGEFRYWTLRLWRMDRCEMRARFGRGDVRSR